MRDLAATLVLEPSHVAVIGCRPEQKRSLGSFMFTQAVAQSDQQLERIILIWASRNLEGQGANDGRDRTSDRPKLVNRLFGPLPKATTTKLTAPEPEIPKFDEPPPPGALDNTAAKPAPAPTQPKPKPAAPPQNDSTSPPAVGPGTAPNGSQTP